jgi:phage gp36-like protein
LTAYCTRTDVELSWGATNVSKWADLDNDADAAKILARINSACDGATDVVNDYLRGGPYTIPFGVPPSQIVTLTAELAGCKLYEPRGTTDLDDTGEQRDRLSAVRNAAINTLRRIRSGAMRLDQLAVKMYPAVSPVETSRDEPAGGYLDDSIHWEGTTQ